MINNATKRAILRWIYLIFAIPIIGYIYSPFAELPNYAPLFDIFHFRSFSFQDSGCMQAFFAVIGVAVWLGTYQLLGYAMAILSLIVLLIGRKVWLLIQTRQSKGSA